MGILGSIGSVVGGFTGMPWLGAVGGGIDSLMDRNAASRGQEDANAFNAQQAQQNRDFQERMRATQYQTAVKDMQAAGLNPMLAYSQGGAGTPSGSMSAPALNKVAAGISSAQQASGTAQALQALELNKAQVDQVRAETSRIVSETLDNRVNTALRVAQTRAADTSADVNEATEPNERAKWRGHVADSAQKMEQLDADLRAGTFSADSARRKSVADRAHSEAALARLEIPKSKAESSFWTETGDASQFIKMLTSLFGMGSSARSIFRR